MAERVDRPADDEREHLRETFDTAAERYHRARPGYPGELYETLVDLAELHPSDRLLEIGCGTGTATVPLAALGFRITCVELGAALAAAARQNLAGFADVTVIQGTFESWRPRPSEHFDLVFAATAWHWLDPELRYRRAWELLRPGGHLAFWSAGHVFPDGGDPFFREIQSVYEEIGEGLPPGATWPKPGNLPDERDEIERSQLFDEVAVRQFDWEVTYDAESYIELLDTFSGHIVMDESQRARLYGEIRRRLRDRSDPRLRRHWGAALHVATRRG